ncbi:uncharacterized protein LOC103505338 [Diaphorina citri]|uniref:Uncharacterized protein LOC103505338 n=1 Tax=Diaphorina citri TaxID=121845 RepID=A0A3Q0IJN4_DIACI|nr:uncharacterized protein LOC103505338 [Diaphorina citri]
MDCFSMKTYRNNVVGNVILRFSRNVTKRTGYFRFKSSRHQTDEPLYCRTHSNDKTTTTSPNMGQSEKFKNTTQDLFELLERVQSCRLDDQRCVLPAYFTQVSLY